MAVSTVELRFATRADEPLLRRAFLEAGRSLPADVLSDPDPLAARQYRAYATDRRSRYPRAETSILVDGGEPAGAITLDRSGARVHVVDLVVLAQYRRRGIASLALGEVLRPGDTATVFVETSDPGARLFFERQGFETVAEQFGLLLMATGTDG